MTIQPVATTYQDCRDGTTLVLHPFWTAAIRKGTVVHAAGADGLTFEPCRRSMRTGSRLTLVEAQAIEGHTWCRRCFDGSGPLVCERCSTYQPNPDHFNHDNGLCDECDAYYASSVIL